ncbi:cellulose synthase operon protein YhjQ/BcsQ [Aeoliella sp.]|uniref:nucleotide-binding protein n=1 Tax=Aeoliella sp. TaxID=2795800 RepID=UPI003CCB8EF9
MRRGGSGKTTLATNLAHALKLSGQRVVLADAEGSAQDAGDPRRGQSHRDRDLDPSLRRVFEPTLRGVGERLTPCFKRLNRFLLRFLHRDVVSLLFLAD